MIQCYRYSLSMAQVEPETVATDSFMVNLQAILFRFCEPFIDANYTKVCTRRTHAYTYLFIQLQIDRIDPLYFAHSSRIDLKDETRINATSNEAEEFRQQHEGDNGMFSIGLIFATASDERVNGSSAQFHLRHLLHYPCDEPLWVP